MSADDEFERDIVRHLLAELDRLSGPAPRWAEPGRTAPVLARIGHQGWVLVGTVIVIGSVLLAGLVLSVGANRLSPPPPATPSPTADLAATLRRPLRIPPVGPSGTCPETPVGLTLQTLGEFQGSGPVWVNDLKDIVLTELPVQNGWYGQKVFWAADTREPGPILVRVVRIDGQGEVGLGLDLTPELMLTNEYGGDLVVGTAPEFPLRTTYIDGVSFRTPGCYLMQMDGTRSTSTVVFAILGRPSGSQASPSQYPAVLTIEGRGNPPVVIDIGTIEVARVACDASGSVTPGEGRAPALPWDLRVVKQNNGQVLLSSHVTDLPKWVVIIGDAAGIGSLPAAGPPGPSCMP
jgi:hypothetical protein